MNDWIKRLTDKIMADIKSAYDKDVEQLTESEKFAIAVCAGVNWKFAGKYGNTPTTDPCLIKKVDGNFKVYLTNEQK